MPKKRKRKKKPSAVVPVIIIIFCLLIVAGTLLAQKMIQDGILTFPTQNTGGEEEPSQMEESFQLSHTELTLYVGAGAALSVSPEGAEIQWSSDNPQVASVNESGWVQAMAPGTTVIRAQSGNAGGECTVTVIPLPEVEVNAAGGFAADEAQLQQLRDLTAQKPLQISVYYRDLATGSTIEYNSGRKYSAGSVVKAPYCKWLMASSVDLQEPITFHTSDILEGGGSVQESPDGTVFTVQELIEKAIRESDNTAYNLLVKRFGFDGFLAYAQSLGVGANQSAGNLFGSMSAAGAGLYFTDLYSWSQLAPEPGQILIDYLCTTTYRKLISAVTDDPVAHKYGYNNGNAGFHDVAIVYSEAPYVLAIFTTLNPDESDTVPYIQSVASCFNGMNQSFL